MHDVAFSLTPSAESISLHHYTHWHTPDAPLSPDAELATLRASLPSKEPYVFIGKSQGIGLALDSIEAHKQQPSACVFIGTPVKTWDGKIAERLKGHAIPTLFIQNKNDSLGTYEALSRLVKSLKIQNASLHKAPGTGQTYSPKDISKRVAEFIQAYV